MPSAVFSHLAPSSRTLLNSDFASMHTFKLRVLIATRMHEKRESVDISSRSMVDSMLTTLLIECAQSSLTTDARDRVYALHSLFASAGLHLPDPDYTKTVAQVYQEATAAVFQQLGSLDVLDHVLLWRKAPPPILVHLPSWSIDWRIMGRSDPFSSRRTSKQVRLE